MNVSIIKIIGCIFRFFVLIFFFLLGIKLIILDSQVDESLVMNLFFRLFGLILIFISFYWLYNSFSKKIKEETYEKWFVGLIIVFAYYLIMTVDQGWEPIATLFDLIKISFVG